MNGRRMRAAAVLASVTLAGSVVSAAPSTASDQPNERYDVSRHQTTDRAAAAQVRAILDHLPADWQANRDAFLDKAGIEPSPAEDAIIAYLERANCEETELNAYIETLLKGVPDDTLFVLAVLGVLSYPTFDAVIGGTKTDPRYSLETGTVGKVRQSMAAARQLWDVKNGDIDVMGMHSDMVVDRARVIRVLRVVFGVSPKDAQEAGTQIVRLIKATPALRGGTNPLFSLNAFAFTGEGDPDFGGISDRIVMGEGIIKALRWTDDIAVGPQMVLSHEFGHHIQFENHAYPATESPANTRKMELMADAYGAYLDAHAKGLNFTPKQIDGTVAVSHLVGDCSVDSLGHHGTPAQRARAARWGADLALKNGSNILPSKRVQALFLTALPGILRG